MSQRKPWTKQEDDLLRKLVSANEKREDDKCKWGQIADLLNQSGTQRTGKQCRERWHNQLKPGIDNQKVWSKAEEHTLFRVQEREGNKWAQIAKELPGRTDNNIKNYFYSTLRKALRKVNTYVQMHKKQSHYRNIKEFKQQNLSKILAVAQKKYESKINLKNQAVQSDAQKIKRLLVQIQRDQQIVPSGQFNATLAEAVDHILEFNRNCKRRKGKKKESQNEEEQSQSQVVSEQIKQPKRSKKKQQKQQKQTLPSKPLFRQPQPQVGQNLFGLNLNNKRSSIFEYSSEDRLMASRNLKKQSSSSGAKQGSSMLYASSGFRAYEGQNPMLDSRNFQIGNNRDTNFLSRIPTLQKRITVRSNESEFDDMIQMGHGNNNPLLWSQHLMIPEESPLRVSLTLQNSYVYNKREARLEKRNSSKK